MVSKNFVKGEIIIVEGTRGDRTYQIKAGEVLICKQNKNKGLVPIARLTEGEMFGEMYLLDQNGYRTASAIAATDVTVEVIFQEEMEQHIQALPPILVSMMQGLSKRLQTTSQSLTGASQEGRFSFLNHLK